MVRGTATDAAALDPRKLEPRIRTHARLGRLGRRLGWLSPRPVDRIRAQVTAFMADYDVLLTPTLAQPGIEAVRWGERGWYANLMANIRYAPYPSLFNLLGWPAASVPAGGTRPLGCRSRCSSSSRRDRTARGRRRSSGSRPSSSACGRGRARSLTADR